MQKDLKGPQADPYSPSGQRPKSRTRGVAPLPVKLPFPKGLVSALGSRFWGALLAQSHASSRCLERRLSPVIHTLAISTLSSRDREREAGGWLSISSASWGMARDSKDTHFVTYFPLF